MTRFSSTMGVCSRLVLKLPSLHFHKPYIVESHMFNAMNVKYPCNIMLTFWFCSCTLLDSWRGWQHAYLQLVLNDS
jgi:hypothetical protein